MPRQALLITLLLIGLASAASWQLGAHASRTEREALTSRLLALESRLDRLDPLDTSRAGETASRHSPSVPPVDASPSGTALDAMPPSDAASLAALARQRHSALDARFRAAPADTSGAHTAEAALRDAAGAAELQIVERQPERLEVECRRTACRIQAHFTDAAEADTWLQAYLLVAVDTLAQAESAAHLDADGVARLTIYGTRR